MSPVIAFYYSYLIEKPFEDVVNELEKEGIQVYQFQHQDMEKISNYIELPDNMFISVKSKKCGIGKATIKKLERLKAAVDMGLDIRFVKKYGIPKATPEGCYLLST